mmetsp:Transcript_40552/g.94836  ORF Transcript_40552/g.94836 Transcript_40552/m.94836 type:complete len:207 (-) Transcript_40552:207-827(-)
MASSPRRPRRMDIRLLLCGGLHVHQRAVLSCVRATASHRLALRHSRVLRRRIPHHRTTQDSGSGACDGSDRRSPAPTESQGDVGVGSGQTRHCKWRWGGSVCGIVGEGRRRHHVLLRHRRGRRRRSANPASHPNSHGSHSPSNGCKLHAPLGIRRRGGRAHRSRRVLDAASDHRRIARGRGFRCRVGRIDSRGRGRDGRSYRGLPR